MTFFIPFSPPVVLGRGSESVAGWDLAAGQGQPTTSVKLAAVVEGSNVSAC